MDLSFQRTPDEERILSRQLYRPGQAQTGPSASTPTAASSFSSPAAKTSTGTTTRRSSGSNSDKQSKGQRILLMILLLGVGYYLLYGNPTQRKKAFISLGVAAWLLLLGSISYCLNLPDLEALNRERMALFTDRSLTPEQRREKFEQLREKERNLTPAQRRQMGELFRKEMERKGNADMVNFLKMTPQEQVAFLKKRAEEWEQRRKEWEQRRQQFRNNAGGNRGNGGGSGNAGGGRGGGPGGGRGGGGPGGGGPPGGFGGGGGSSGFANYLDRSSPESRAGRIYQRALMAQLGLGGGFGRGGPGGGGGGSGGGGKR